ncbi:MAG: hypothetical protein ACT4QA_20715 [Panacagrimonas sp.]
MDRRPRSETTQRSPERWCAFAWRAALAAIALGASACATAPPVTTPPPAEGSQEPVTDRSLATKRPGKRRRGCDRSGDGSMVDAAQTVLEETTCNSALWLDGLVGEGGGDLDAARRTHGYVETTISHSEFNKTDIRTKARVRMELPNWERRLSAFVGLEDEDDFVRDRSEQFALRSEFPSVGDDDKWLAGLGYSLPSSERLQTDFRIGAASLTHPRAFVQARAHLNIYADELNLVYARLTPFYNSRLGFGATFGLDYDRVLSERLLLRFVESATRSESSGGLDWVSAIILYQNLGQQRGIAWEGFVRGQTQAAEPLDEYGLRAVLRFPILKDLLIGEFLSGYSWRTDPDVPSDGSYLVGLGLKLPFGEKGERR